MKDAIQKLVILVAKTLEPAHRSVDSTIWDVGYFSYLLSRKQKSHLSRICEQKGWQKPNNYSITIKGSSIKHILNSRIGSDNLTVNECLDLVLNALNEKSEVAINERENQQVFMLNGNKKISIKGNSLYASLIVEIKEEGLVLKTAYPLTYRKLEAIKRGR